MNYYPSEFNQVMRARVEAAQLLAKRQLIEERRQPLPGRIQWAGADGRAFEKYVLTVFLAFAKEACTLATDGTWGIDQIRSEAEEFLRRFTIEAYSSDGVYRNGEHLPKMIGDWGHLEEEVSLRYRASEYWREYEDALLDAAQAQARKPASETNLTRNRKEQVDSFLQSCNALLETKLSRKHLWRGAGHTTDRQFQFWQANDPKATLQDDQNFSRLLAMKPEDFVQLLRRKKLLEQTAAEGRVAQNVN